MFDPPTASPIAAASDWLVALATGSLAVGLSVLAVAMVGLLMLGGRLPVRRGLQVILGCFVVLGAPSIAAGLAGSWQSSATEAPPPPPPMATQPPRDLPPATYDPYAGASLRQD